VVAGRGDRVVHDRLFEELSRLGVASGRDAARDYDGVAEQRHLDPDECVGVEADGVIDDALGDRVGDAVGMPRKDVFCDVESLAAGGHEFLLGK
jgi:hypothetical protein